MALTQEQASKFQTWFVTKAKNKNCPVCGASHWAPSDIIVAPIFSEGSSTLGGPVTLIAPMVCMNCGYIHFFSDAVIGLVK